MLVTQVGWEGWRPAGLLGRPWGMMSTRTARCGLYHKGCATRGVTGGTWCAASFALRAGRHCHAGRQCVGCKLYSSAEQSGERASGPRSGHALWASCSRAYVDQRACSATCKCTNGSIRMEGIGGGAPGRRAGGQPAAASGRAGSLQGGMLADGRAGRFAAQACPSSQACPAMLA